MLLKALIKTTVVSLTAELEKAFGAAFKASGRPADEAEIKRACANIMKSVDKNKDNKITLEEYIQYYTSLSLY